MTLACRAYKACEWLRRRSPSWVADNEWLLCKMDRLWLAMAHEERYALFCREHGL